MDWLVWGAVVAVAVGVVQWLVARRRRQTVNELTGGLWGWLFFGSRKGEKGKGGGR
ncbi:MAG: hypothetical protein AB1609_16215 [Bacillota bacterium]